MNLAELMGWATILTQLVLCFLLLPSVLICSAIVMYRLAKLFVEEVS